MKNRTIAWSQLSAVLLLALLPLGTELLPGRLAQVGAAAWLCPLLAGVGVVALGLLEMTALIYSSVRSTSSSSTPASSAYSLTAAPISIRLRRSAFALSPFCP